MSFALIGLSGSGKSAFVTIRGYTVVAYSFVKVRGTKALKYARVCSNKDKFVQHQSKHARAYVIMGGLLVCILDKFLVKLHV